MSHEKGCNVTVVCPHGEVFSVPAGSESCHADLDQAILPDHPVGMELTLEHLPDDRGPVLASTVSYPGRL